MKEMNKEWRFSKRDRITTTSFMFFFCSVFSLFAVRISKERKERTNDCAKVVYARRLLILFMHFNLLRITRVRRWSLCTYAIRESLSHRQRQHM